MCGYPWIYLRNGAADTILPVAGVKGRLLSGCCIVGPAQPESPGLVPTEVEGVRTPGLIAWLHPRLTFVPKYLTF